MNSILGNVDSNIFEGSTSETWAIIDGQVLCAINAGELVKKPRKICKAQLYIADNYCDNHASMRCQRRRGHKGKHRERFFRSTGRFDEIDFPPKNNEIIVRWDKDETECKKCYGSGYLYPPIFFETKRNLNRLVKKGLRDADVAKDQIWDLERFICEVYPEVDYFVDCPKCDGTGLKRKGKI
jgi:hypothetical protein